MGHSSRKPVGRLRTRRYRKTQGRGSRCLSAYTRAARGMEKVCRAGYGGLGRGGEEGRQRSGCSAEGLQGNAREIQVGVLTNNTRSGTLADGGGDFAAVLITPSR